MYANLYGLAHLKEDTNPEVHEGLGEVDDTLARVVNGHGGHC